MSVEDSSRNSIVVLLIIGSLILFSGLAIILIKPTIENPISCNDEDVDICNMETMEKYASRGSGTNGDPYIIENLVFDSGFSIVLYWNENPIAFIIQNCEFNSAFFSLMGVNYDYGGFSPFSKEVSILNNIFHDAQLFISSCLIHSVQNNTFYGNSDGSRISNSYVENFIENSFESSKFEIRVADNFNECPQLFNVFENNTINGVEIGFFEDIFNVSISKTYSLLFVYNSGLIDIENQFISNSSIGIKIAFCENLTITNSSVIDCETAIYIRNSEHVTVQNCTLTNNEVGVEHEHNSEFINVKFNQIVNSTSYAIISNSFFCTVTFNNFIDNAIGEFSQAYDIGLNNDWDYNYWSDWTSGDYLIDGYGPVFEKDRHPLTTPIDF